MKKKIIILLSLFVILTICVLLDVTGVIDYNVYNLLSTNRIDFLTTCANVVTSLASSQAIIIITLILIFALDTNHQRIFVIINTIISAGIIILSKNIFLRERPLIGSELLSSYSFPSGHSLIATTYYGFLIYLLRRSKCKEEYKVIGTTFLTTLIVLICLSRLILNVHYVTKEKFDIGIIQIYSPYGNKIKVYNKERSICDMIKHSDEFELELYNKILVNYMKSKDKDLNKLVNYAKMFNIYDKVISILEVLIE